jgi:hypothetical protein
MNSQEAKEEAKETTKKYEDILLKDKALRFWKIILERYKDGIKNPLENLSFWKRDYGFASDELEKIFHMLTKGIEEEGKIYKLEKSGESYFAVLEEKEEDREEDKEKKTIRAPFVVVNDVLYQQAYDPQTDTTYFVKFDGRAYEKVEKIEADEFIYIPNELERDPREKKPIVMLAKWPEDYVSIPNLITKIENFIYKYGDVKDTDRRFLTLFAILTWVYDRMESVPYARFLADTGKGKTRMLKILHQICYNSFMAAGSSTISGALRMQSKWQGTACFNETDFKNTEDTSLFVKWVNNGFEKGLPIIMSNKENPNVRDIFDPFGPKLFAMKRPFEDPATEARLISVEMYETKRKDIPIHLPPEFYEEGLRIRNMLLDFRLKNWKTIANVPQEAIEKVRNLDVEPRLKQLMLPLLPIVLAYDGGLDEFIRFVKKRQAEVRKQRAMSWEGTVFNTLLGIANNDIAEDEFTEYRDDEGNLIVITTKMIANELNTSPKNVATTLREIGFDIEIKRVALRDKSKVVRRIVVPSWDKWVEAVSRYYPELEDGFPPVPQCLKSDKYIDPNTLSSLSSVTGVTSVTNVTKKEVNENNVTDVTFVTPVTEDTSDEIAGKYSKLEEEIIQFIKNNQTMPYDFDVISFFAERYEEEDVKKVLNQLIKRGIVIQRSDGKLELNWAKLMGGGE